MNKTRGAATFIILLLPGNAAGIEEYFNSGRTADDLFDDCLKRIIEE